MRPAQGRLASEEGGRCNLPAERAPPSTPGLGQLIPQVASRSRLDHRRRWPLGGPRRTGDARTRWRLLNLPRQSGLGRGWSHRAGPPSSQQALGCRLLLHVCRDAGCRVTAHRPLLGRESRHLLPHPGGLKDHRRQVSCHVTAGRHLGDRNGSACQPGEPQPRGLCAPARFPIEPRYL